MQRLCHAAGIAAASFLALAAGSASAATFTQQSGFGYAADGNFSPCESATVNAGFSSGTVFSADDFSTGGSCVGNFSVTIDTLAQTLTLTGLESGNYGEGVLTIAAIGGLTITGLTTISYENLFDPDFYADDDDTRNVPAPELAFTGNSIKILFSTNGTSPPSQFVYREGGQAVFAYTAAPAPEPAVWAMMLLGFGGAGAMIRRRVRVAAA